MSKSIPRLLLPLALCAALTGCSDEPEVAPAEPAAEAAPAVWKRSARRRQSWLR